MAKVEALEVKERRTKKEVELKYYLPEEVIAK